MNQNHFIRFVQKGFTLVELLIVVIILSILAAIALPQFSASTEEAKLAALDSTLGNMRSVIDLYRQQHGAYPGDLTAISAGCPVGGASAPASATPGTEDAFLYQLTYYTNAAGEACTSSDADYKFGPYLKKQDMAQNPITESGEIAIVTDGILGMAGAANPFAAVPATGWKYNTGSGQFIADDSRFIPPGTAIPDPTYDQL